ncbi:MAG TPA: marine proteobacterial sortase target protein [Gammaproteobacteria bacterium]|nr:marine proteobacterial sortase target protein [Gammaproteobacteria bacterium]
MTSSKAKRAGRRVAWLLEPHPAARAPDFAQRLARARLLLLKRRESSWPWLPLCLLLAASLAAGSHAPRALAEDGGARSSTPDAARIGAGTLVLRGAVAVPAPRLSTAVEIAVSGLVARVAVRQSFRNDSSEWVEGVYVFPLPDGAAVDRLRMTIGDRVVEGEIREREAARDSYARARETGRRASLIEQDRPNLFATSFANIAPGETVTVEIGYQESLRYAAGVFVLRFPMTVTPRYEPGGGTAAAGARTLRAQPVPATESQRVRLVVDIAAGFTLDGIDSRHHAVRVEDRGDRYHIELDGDTAPADRDFELAWRPVIGSEPGQAVFTETQDGERYALLLLMPPDYAGAGPAQPREMIFVIDTSGSMTGEPLEQAKDSIELALARLAPGDRFNLIQFNSLAESLYLEPRPATAETRAEALRYLRALQADGGTEMLPAVALALGGAAPPSHLSQIVFVTDGSVGNEEQVFALIGERLGEARLFTVGIGAAPNSWFMRKAAEFGRGSFTYVGDRSRVRADMEALFARLENPVLTDLAVDWPGDGPVEAWPARSPDLYAGEPLVLTARLGAMQTGTLALSGRTLGGDWLRQGKLGTGRESPGIAALWARRKIEALTDERVRGGDAERIRTEIVQTALRHHLVSEHTSLVAVDRTPARPAGFDLAAAVVPNALPHGMVLAGLPQTATTAALNGLVGAVCLFGALLSAAALAWGRTGLSAGRVSTRHGGRIEMRPAPPP